MKVKSLRSEEMETTVYLDENIIKNIGSSDVLSFLSSKLKADLGQDIFKFSGHS
jgi:hypothetical protein